MPKLSHHLCAECYSSMTRQWKKETQADAARVVEMVRASPPHMMPRLIAMPVIFAAFKARDASQFFLTNLQYQIVWDRDEGIGIIHTAQAFRALISFIISRTLPFASIMSLARDHLRSVAPTQIRAKRT